jgi:hypothetical protein
MRRNYKTAKIEVTLETYVTLRQDWLPTLSGMVSQEYVARGHRVFNGEMEWCYFHTEAEACAWCDQAFDIVAATATPPPPPSKEGEE